MPKLHTLVQLSFKEYAETWAELIYTFYQQGMSDEGIFTDLQMSSEEEVQFSVELSTVLTMIAVMSFEAKPKMISNEKNRSKLFESIVMRTYRKVIGEENDELLNSCSQFYQSRYEIFSKICTHIHSKKPEKRQPELVGFARYLAAQASQKEEPEKAQALQRLGILLSSASDAYMKLLENSGQDSIQLDGKPSFVVKKEK